MNWLRRAPRIVRVELLAFAWVGVLFALDEYLDLPALLFHEAPTPLRHHEFLMEFGSLLIVGGIVVTLTWFAYRRFRDLDALLVMCAWCRKVRVEDRWMSLETFLHDRDAIDASRGFCPDCYARGAAADER
jgi:hypothetical protein